MDNTGALIKEYRTQQGLSLRELGEKCALSASYLSMVERNMTSINISLLQKITKALDLSMSLFFEPPKSPSSCIIRGHNRPFFKTEGSPDIYFSLAGNLPPDKGILEPIIVQMMPEKAHIEIKPIAHEGEEFALVLDGIITVQIESIVYELYPMDSFHIMSNTPHTVRNLSNRLASILHVNTPKFSRAE